METKCTGNCMQCNIMQRQYCSSQITYNNMKMMERMSEQLNELRDELKAIKEKAEQDEHDSLINPIE